MTISEPGTISAATSGNAAEEGSLGTAIGVGLSSASPVTEIALAPSAQRLDRDLGAERLEHPLGVVARRGALDDGRAAGHVECRQQQRRFHLRGGDLQPVLDRKRRARAFERHRQEPAFARVRHRAEQRQRIEHARIGRRLSDASPVKIVVIGVVATAPMVRRTPVPELPKSSTSDGSRKPPTPTPWTRHSPSPSRATSAPKPAHRLGGVEHVVGFEQAGDLGLAHGQRAQDERPVRNGFVAGRRHRALEARLPCGR